MATIIQDYGPIYGEVVNGTVQGRPNGSVYVPSSNVVTMSTAATTFYVNASNVFRLTGTNAFKLVAVSQDLSNYIQRQVFSDSDCTALIARTSGLAGSFNSTVSLFANKLADAAAPEVGDTCYFRVQLISTSGDAVATSEVIPLECVTI